MLKTMKVKEDNMYAAAQRGFINATDLADYLVRKGLPFREAYKISGAIVSHTASQTVRYLKHFRLRIIRHSRMYLRKISMMRLI